MWNLDLKNDMSMYSGIVWGWEPVRVEGEEEGERCCEHDQSNS
jgi:hypothetical protein